MQGEKKNVFKNTKQDRQVELLFTVRCNYFLIKVFTNSQCIPATDGKVKTKTARK